MVEQQQVQKDEQTYHDAIERISQIIHPFSLDSQQWQTQRNLLTHLAPPLQVLWELAQTYNTQKAQKAIDTFEKQIDSFAQGYQMSIATGSSELLVTPGNCLMVKQP